MQRNIAGLACYSAGVAGLASFFSPQQQAAASSDVGDVVHRLLGSGSAAAHGHDHRQPCNSSSSCHVVTGAGVMSEREGRRGVVSEARKERRLASNRESARRLRMRRRRQLDELSSCVAELRAANRLLVVELNRAEARHAQVVRENVRLREEARRLRERLGVGETDQAEAEGGSDETEGTP